MDFFEAQDRARRRTKWLVLLFALALGGTVIASYGAAITLLRFQELQERHAAGRHQDAFRFSTPTGTWWDPRVFGWVGVVTVSVVGFASLFKWAQLRGGGSVVARRVGGRLLAANTTDLNERRLLNVVEEMAIASGIPVPAVFVLDDEPGLNAFAAGLTTNDAAVAVTRGTLEKLSRDELQGVIGHEFSHILNGDMRLNVRLAAIVFGILVIGLIGRGMLRSLAQGRFRGGGGKNKGGGILVLLAIGLALVIIGYVGYFFGRLIQAAVSRQREFLADASSVQFTRNPAGISGALKKIGGYALGGHIAHNAAGEFGHFFFAQAFKSGFSGLWSTHPDVNERIRAIDPQWDGKLFAPPSVVDVAQESFVTAGFAGGPPAGAHNAAEPPPLSSFPAPRPRVAFRPTQAVAAIGALTEAHLTRAQSLLESIPTRVREAARDPASVPVLVYGLLLDGDLSAREQQQALVARHAGEDAAALLRHLRPALSIIDPDARLPLLQIALPALRELDAPARDRFATTLDELVHADGRVTTFEFAVQKMLLTQLRPPNPATQFDSFSAVRAEIAVVLSALAHLNPADAATGFAAGLATLPPPANAGALLASDACGLAEVDAALDKLAVSSLPIKRRVLLAAAQVIGQDGTITAEEGELFRALAATLAVPMPSLDVAAA